MSLERYFSFVAFCVSMPMNMSLEARVRLRLRLIFVSVWPFLLGCCPPGCLAPALSLCSSSWLASLISDAGSALCIILSRKVNGVVC